MSRVVTVTGAASGVGKALSLMFARAGYAVAALDIDAARAEETAAAIEAEGGRNLALCVNVSDPEAVAAAAAAAESALGAVTTLCANVGVQQIGAIDRLTPREWQWVLLVNVGGTVNTVTAFLPSMRRATGVRRILLTASAGVFVPSPLLAAYTASKDAVVGFGETLRLELAAEDIGVSILFPAGMIARHLESSIAARPEAVGENTMSNDDLMALVTGPATQMSEVMDADRTVRNVVDDLERGEPYIFTHGHYREQIVARHDQILAAFDRMQVHQK